MATTADLSATLARAITRDDADLVIDLHDVEFMDASTIGVIVRGRGFLRSRSRSLSLRAPSTCARRVLDLCGLGEYVDSDPTSAPRSGAATLGARVEVAAIDLTERPRDRAVAAAWYA